MRPLHYCRAITMWTMNTYWHARCARPLGPSTCVQPTRYFWVFTRSGPIRNSRAAILLKLFENNSPDLVSRMRQAFYTNPFECMNDGGTIDVPYRTLPPLDFSRDILFSQESHLRVLRIPPCGWSDLGTPARVLAVPRRPFPIGSLAMNYPQKADILNLASFAFSRCRILAGARPAPVNGINEDLKI